MISKNGFLPLLDRKWLTPQQARSLDRQWGRWKTSCSDSPGETRSWHWKPDHALYKLARIYRAGAGRSRESSPMTPTLSWLHRHSLSDQRRPINHAALSAGMRIPVAHFPFKAYCARSVFTWRCTWVVSETLRESPSPSLCPFFVVVRELQKHNAFFTICSGFILGGIS